VSLYISLTLSKIWLLIIDISRYKYRVDICTYKNRSLFCFRVWKWQKGVKLHGTNLAVDLDIIFVHIFRDNTFYRGDDDWSKA